MKTAVNVTSGDAIRLPQPVSTTAPKESFNRHQRMNGSTITMPADPLMIVQTNTPWLPRPSKLETFISDWIPPTDLTTTAGVFAFDVSNRVLLAFVRTRGLDIVGGHLEKDSQGIRECPAAAAEREAAEETGAILRDIRPIGYRKITVPQPPANYPYPTPVNYQAFFAARIVSLGPVGMPAECGEPTFLVHEMAIKEFAIVQHIHLYDAARAALGLTQ